jgi:hypothetical protein
VAKHRINQLEIEIEVGPADLGRALIERMSQLHPRRIVPLLDRVCGDLSGPDRYDRIDTLELELGPIPIDDFDDAFIRALEAALRSALSRQLGPRAAERPEIAAFELLEGFARTGNLPWWAEREREGLIADRIAMLVDSASERWFELLRALADDPAAMVRLAMHCADQPIEAIAQRAGLAPERLTELRELERWVANTGVFGATRVAEGRVRGAWLAALGHGAASRGAPPAELLGELIAQAPIVAPPLRRAIAASSSSQDTSESTPAWLALAAESVLPRIEPAHVPESGEVDRSISMPAEPRRDADEDANEDADETRDGDEPDADQSELDESEFDRATAHRDEPESLDRPRDRTPPPNTAASDEASAPDASGEPSSSTAEPRPDGGSRATRASHGARPANEPESIDRASSLHLREAPANLKARRRALEKLETLYVDDAGLVILWPFLERFFVRVGLLDLDRRFIDEQATMQAIALLSQLAIEDPEPAEFRLPLAKLLCGRAPETPFVLERPLEPEQIAECDRLIAAAIENAPILRDMSVAAFRANFLQRSAALSIREGAWQLDVEDQPHDLVLERFPWSWSWVKLAWMPDPLFVRW